MAKKGNRLRFSKEEDENLIDEIAKHPSLYDGSHKLYKDQIVRDNTWDDIAERIGKTVTEIKTRWKSLKDVYAKKRKETNQGTSSSARHTRKWEHMDTLTFLENITNQRSNVTANSEKEDEERAFEDDSIRDNIEDVHPVEHDAMPPIDNYFTPVIKKRKTSSDKFLDILHARKEDRSEVLKNIEACMKSTEKHPIHLFFESMAETVLNIISQLELENTNSSAPRQNLCENSLSTITEAAQSSNECNKYTDCADLFSQYNI